MHLAEKKPGTAGLLQPGCESNSLSGGEKDGKMTLSDDFTSYCLTPGGKSGRKHCAFLGVRIPTALPCPSTVCLGCQSDSRLFDKWPGEGRNSEDGELTD